MELKDIIKRIMLENSLSQIELARILGVNSARITEWVTGKTKPGYDNLKQICIKLKISGDRILGIDE